MATIPTVSHGAYPQSSRRTYMSIRAFNGSFFKYTTSVDPVTYGTSGDISQTVTGATSSNCPAGRTLRENGKKLYPGANPGVNTYMVGVYDASSGLSGFIDPNDSVFTIYNTDKPTYLADGVSATDNMTADKAPGVYTVGDIVTTGGNITTPNDITGGSLGFTSSNTLTQSGATSLTADCSIGSMFIISITSGTGFTIDASNVTEGQIVYFVFNNTGAFAPSVTMGANIRELEVATVAQNLQIVANRNATMHFIGYTTILHEVSRTINTSS